MLKITTTQSNDGVLTISIAGRLTRDGCKTVEQALKNAQNQHHQVKIDLAGIRLVDQPSVEYLAHVRRHIELVNVPSYVTRWIDHISNEPGLNKLGIQSE